MTERHIKCAEHCIGLSRKRPYTRHGRKFYRPYRNFYATGADQQTWDELVEAGFASRGEGNQHGGYTYSLTRKGLDWLGGELGIKIYDEEE